MSLLARITLRLVAVAAVTLAVALLWILTETNDRLHLEAATSAERIAARWESRPGLGSFGVTSATFVSAWEPGAAIAAIVPGTCVEIVSPYEGAQKFCTSWDGIGDAAPGWFTAAFGALYPAGDKITRPVSFRGRALGEVIAMPDPRSATERAWQQVRVLVGVAAAMAAGMCLLTGLAVAHALLPVQTIVRALRDLEGGDLGGRLPPLPATEFQSIARAFNDMASRLELNTAERQQLTRRLFEVQEHERRSLARELHDEFGQCLTATGALAASIEAGTPPGHADLADDARAIGRITAQMKTTMKEALARLRVPELDEIGLEASLRSMIGQWSRHGGGRTRFQLDMQPDLPALAPAEALGVYRIVQECLTNAARHGRPNEVKVRIGRDGNRVVLSVEDDGGGDPERVKAASGLGILGIRERIAALGGSLAIGRSAGGLSVTARIPSLVDAAA